MDFHVGEANPRHTHDPHAAVFRLPAELLAEAFHHVVESGLQDSDTRFATRTFTFLQVCKRWNEVSVGFPRLWGYWVAGAVKAWPLFDSRSKGTPIFLTWRHQLHNSARDILMDPAIPKRIHRLDFIGTSEQLERLLGAFDSSPPYNLSSIRLQISTHRGREPREHLSRFLSLSFPKLTRLNLLNFLPGSSSPILATPTDLTSLSLFLPYLKREPYTLSQFSQILQRHPNLRELDLNCGAIPLPGPPGALVSFVLPRLVDLRLYGVEAAILRFIDLIGMSSPLHDVILRFDCPGSAVPDHTSTMKKILVVYYECQGLNHPRTINRLVISYNSGKRCLVFDTRSHPSAMSNLTSNLKLQFEGISGSAGVDLVKAGIPLFPLDNLQVFAADGFASYGDWYSGVFQKMKNHSPPRFGR